MCASGVTLSPVQAKGWLSALDACPRVPQIASILSTQHLSREPPDSSLDPLLDPSINFADPALSASLASLPSADRSDERCAPIRPPGF